MTSGVDLLCVGNVIRNQKTAVWQRIQPQDPGILLKRAEKPDRLYSKQAQAIASLKILWLMIMIFILF